MCTLTVSAERLAGLAFREFRRCDNDADFNCAARGVGRFLCTAQPNARARAPRPPACLDVSESQGASRRPSGEPRLPETLARRAGDHPLRRSARSRLVEPSDQGGRVSGRIARPHPADAGDRTLARQPQCLALRPEADLLSVVPALASARSLRGAAGPSQTGDASAEQIDSPEMREGGARRARADEAERKPAMNAMRLDTPAAPSY